MAPSTASHQLPGMRFCRISALTSEKGQKLNGSVGRVERSSPNQRIAVYLDGVAEPISIKQSNLEWLSTLHEELESAVGRKTFREDAFNAMIIDNTIRGSPKRLSALRVSGASGEARCRGLLLAFQDAVKRMNKQGKPIIVHFSDLNVARAISHIMIGKSVKLDSSVNCYLQGIANSLRKANPSLLLANFAPHRVEQDSFIQNKGKHRYQSVRESTYHCYPCNHSDYYDALEVRYRSDDNALLHEIWLDYGPAETTLYFKNCVALEETDRLYPKILAQVDPQSFWSSIVHYDAMIKALAEELAVEEELVNAWKALKNGIIGSRRKILHSCGPSCLPDENGKWQIRNNQEHERVSFENAKAALISVTTSTLDLCTSGASIRFEILEYYRGTKIEKLIMDLTKAASTKGTGKLIKLLTDLLPNGDGDACTLCGKTGDLRQCNKCKSISYCSRDCQKRDWKKHKKNCGHLASMKEGPEIKANLYKPRTTLPTKRSLFSEVSGIGRLEVMWSGGQGKNVINFGAAPSLVAPQSGGLPESMIEFDDLSELDPLLRFLVTCGPLPDIEMAKGCVDDALRMVDGNVSKLRVQSAGFTALEWAAKIGTKPTVQWLCTDERTKALVKIGCPIGWACYTGQVDIARYLKLQGADPAATDDILWGDIPVLCVAAQNGQLEAMKFLVDDCGHDIDMVDINGHGILENIEDAGNWRELPGHAAAHEWTKKKTAERGNG